MLLLLHKQVLMVLSMVLSMVVVVVVVVPSVVMRVVNLPVVKLVNETLRGSVVVALVSWQQRHLMRPLLAAC